MKYKIKFAFTHEDKTEYETDDPYEAIQIIKNFDQKSYVKKLSKKQEKIISRNIFLELSTND